MKVASIAIEYESTFFSFFKLHGLRTFYYYYYYKEIEAVIHNNEGTWKQLSTIMKAHENKRERLRGKCLIPRVFSALEIFGGW